tara:strand:+ start:1289 stop:1426 length:138 start_codon:yes stop_codon:yes gene_type:complete
MKIIDFSSFYLIEKRIHSILTKITAITFNKVVVNNYKWNYELFKF